MRWRARMCQCERCDVKTTRTLHQTARTETPVRRITDIAIEIVSDWRPLAFEAAPYVRAMLDLATIRDYYGADSAEEVVLRFLTNAGKWHGPVARRVKAELNLMCRVHRRTVNREERDARKRANSETQPECDGAGAPSRGAR